MRTEISGFYAVPVFLSDSTGAVFHMYDKQNVRKILRRIKSSITDLPRSVNENASKSLTNLANKVWVLMDLIILLILSRIISTTNLGAHKQDITH